MENILLSKHQFVIKYLKRCLKGNTYAYVRRCRAKQYGGVRQKSFSRLHLEYFSSEKKIWIHSHWKNNLDTFIP